MTSKIPIMMSGSVSFAMKSGQVTQNTTFFFLLSFTLHFCYFLGILEIDLISCLLLYGVAFLRIENPPVITYFTMMELFPEKVIRGMFYQ